MRQENIFEKFLNFGIGTIFYLKKNFKKIIDEIENESRNHSEELEKVKDEFIKILKAPKKLFENFIKSCGFVTKEDLEKIKEEIKNG